MSDQLAGLSDVTVVVADTGDINAIKEFTPTDATTNPSLIYKAAQMEEYQSLIDEAVDYGKSKSDNADDQLAETLDFLAVKFGTEILGIVPGLVSTEVDARLSFNTEATIAKAHKLIALYEAAGIGKERVLIKIASTWEGIRACEELEKEGIHCNLTLLFSIYQAAACAEAGATLISPFVGRILDWHKKAEGREFEAKEDPGVISVTRIYNYYKKFGYDTVVMGASFRSKDEILHLAGCDKLTIAPKLLKELKESTDPVTLFLDATKSVEESEDTEKIGTDVNEFRWGMNEDPMATEKLSEGIRNFAADTRKLEDLLRPRFN